MNMHGIAIWAKSSDAGKDLKADLHINVWKLSEDSRDRHLDIGIMLNGRQGVQSLFVYVPSQTFSLDDFHDLGSLLLNDETTCAAVFNEHLTVTKTHPGTHGDIVINGKKSKKRFILYRLDPASKSSVELKSCDHKGSVIEILLPDDSECRNDAACCDCWAYVRFRISGECICNMFARDELANSALQNFSSNVEVFDIRINEVRTLDASLITKMHNHANGNTPLKFSSIQFFFMCKSTEEVVLATKIQTSARYLEEGTWDKYKPAPSGGNSIKKNSIIAHQWKRVDDGSGCSDFTMLVKTRFEVLHWKKILIFVFVVIVLGCVGSLLASGIEGCWRNPITIEKSVQSADEIREKGHETAKGAAD
ncbi:hypothetical protein [Nitratidesulfovibrio vulgaris]|uniref:hypothetical protein n=1 Tax=Nitratidesulfovibrio vulgaris TaxID=881 RepID=UPI0023010CDD|nr:hypothetical protein [Nitratidesulfovibrio vulgaris]WCB46639.1 hypothetical protein PH214_00705 [Nitratidesulfovibrio vulgaris]